MPFQSTKRVKTKSIIVQILRMVIIILSLTNAQDKDKPNLSGFSLLEDSSNDTMHCFVERNFSLRFVPSSSSANKKHQQLLKYPQYITCNIIHHCYKDNFELHHKLKWQTWVIKFLLRNSTMHITSEMQNWQGAKSTCRMQNKNARNALTFWLGLLLHFLSILQDVHFQWLLRYRY